MLLHDLMERCTGHATCKMRLSNCLSSWESRNFDPCVFTNENYHMLLNLSSWESRNFDPCVFTNENYRMLLTIYKYCGFFFFFLIPGEIFQNKSNKHFSVDSMGLWSQGFGVSKIFLLSDGWNSSFLRITCREFTKKTCQIPLAQLTVLLALAFREWDMLQWSSRNTYLYCLKFMWKIVKTHWIPLYIHYCAVIVTPKLKCYIFNKF